MNHPDPAGRWWDGGSLYEIYVRSWQDSDGDGYGDLRGVIDRLDHLSWLGIDGIWLSPTMPSPDQDWGYDVSDYFGVHPELGTIGDLDRLIGEASQRGIRVLLDLVPNHTSSAHPWFIEACTGRDAPGRDWYVWADPGPDGAVPNNWLDATGNPAWTLHPATAQFYLHNYLAAQPDLNWWNDAVHDEFEDILRFWFDRGVAGVRIDVANGLYHDRQLRDNPPAREGPGTRFSQGRVYSANRPEVHDIYRSWRKLAAGYSPSRLLLGETWVFEPTELARYYGNDDELQLGFNFSFLFAPFEAQALSRVVRDTLAALPAGACPVWVGSNHDVSRFPTRWAGGDPRRARLALAVLCTLPGTVVLYAGDELGLPDVDVPADQRRDPMTRWATDGRFNRDRARTPMPWDEGPNAGFAAEGVPPWLPVGDRRGRSVAAQLDDPASVLWFTHRLLDLRRRALGPGAAYEPLPAARDQWVYRAGQLAVAANFSSAPAVVELPPGTPELSSTRTGVDERRGGRSEQLAPWEALLLLT
jgi:alpha-glucosidase